MTAQANSVNAAAAAAAAAAASASHQNPPIGPPSSMGMSNMGGPPQGGIGMKPSTQKPPPGALQAVQQVKAAAAMQTASPHMQVGYVIYPFILK